MKLTKSLEGKRVKDDELSPEICLYIKQWVKEHSEEINKIILENSKKK